MRTNKLLLTFALLLITVGLSAQIVEPVKWKFDSKNLGNNEMELIFMAEIESGWHLYDTSLPEGGPISTSINYSDSTKFEFVGELQKDPAPTEVFDKTFQMQLRYFSNTVVLKQKIKITGKDVSEITGYVEFMSCNDETCTPPAEADFSFNVKNMNSTQPLAGDVEKANTLVTNKGNEGSSETLWLFFFFSFLAGLAAILTPCVFPMIPMTVSFFMHSGESKLKSRLNASFYGISIIAIYTIIGTIVAVIFGPDIANWLSTHWIPNLLFFLIFLIFAFSFFGMFEIVLPSWLVNKSDKQVDKGGLLGSFFMALTLVLVSFSCTGPIVGAILVESAGGQVLKPIVGMFGFSLAFALPFTLFALFPGWLSNLPKSGGWLNSVKVVLGFLELALGLKFLSIADQTYHWGILDREVYLAIWIVIFTLLGFYLLGKLKFAHDSDTKFVTVPKLMLSIITFSFVVYLIPGMFGAPLKAISGYLPPQSTHDFDLHQIIREEVNLVTSGSDFQQKEDNKTLCEKPKYSEFLHLPHGLEGYFDYEQGLACAKAQNKPIFIDFTGHGCVNCREMEATVWSDPRVLQRLKNDFVIIALYVDDKTKLPENEWIVSKYDNKAKKTLGKKYADFQISNYGVNAQPYYVLLDNEGNKLAEPKAYDLNPDNFVEFLDHGLANFRKK
ncbi:MAG: disulfide bond formation protein DsbD [Bacteroidetes bacterium GWF2_42_66]|nr:MAG: disulfide bond formation protein DsbD [Bacteroidetes bacterium GWA2_42_15]OFY00400.1 MAG: disulfide bond formation protein DsbD [Bacteroidetes bacterium GWE2_42_39]OFY47216.1 MAG: disulfide bond formation protein DsbD [Bacteroidetes bacterium GWF2_42_66]HBL76663.1 disulfide bond formation protein DsbD [Prolixibacteraceae bacterium]HCR89806.1 disulfide bond formation protein DsbD [Prolixibacteraceae bacterium]